ncbi:MAG: phosphomannomutase/phosphoglucomutase [bacterium]|nr:phosphomannomutase/phosphoglucomutase [bacterium]MDE0233931.1 phosphomannomutase/phosphoglucomutase [bacterium]
MGTDAGGTRRPGGSPLAKPAERVGDGTPPPERERSNAVEDLFKAYDIRGDTATGAFTPDHARRIGAAFGRFGGGGTVAVGRDCRESSPLLASALIEGIVSAGADVLDLGAVATEVVYYVSGAADVAGAVVTASHNPPQWNGIKLCMPGAVPVGDGSGLEKVRRMAAQPAAPAARQGTVSARDVIEGYVNHIFSIVDSKSIAPLRVVVDGGNGMAATVVDPVFSRLPISLTGLYLTPDGRFPNHPPDPIDPANLADLVAKVVSIGADLGVAFDGDADRAFFVDNRGKPLSGSAVTTLIARWMLASAPGGRVVHNLICSRSVPEAISAAGGVPVRSRVGHSFMKQMMAETGAVFGGEHSGHYYFASHFRADSGMLATLSLIQILSGTGRTLSDLHGEVTPYHASGEINLAVADRERSLEEVAKAFSSARQDRLDGLTVSWPDRWFNLRPSNTEPLLRLNVEGPDPASVDGLAARVKSLVEI